MFNSKKFFTLCATSIAGFSAVASIAPVSVFADAAKNGETVVTYDGTPQPAEWGLSVPATVKLTEPCPNSNAHFMFDNSGSAKVAIVSVDGNDFEDASKDRTFTVNGVSANLNGDKMLLKDEKTGNTQSMYAHVFNQGELAPTTWDIKSGDHILKSNIEGLEFTSSKDGNSSKKLERGIQFGSTFTPGETDFNYKNTISWTATEKTS